MPASRRKSAPHPLARAWAALAKRVETRLMLTLLAVSGSLWAFADIADEVREGETTGFDRAVLLAFRTPGDLGTPVGPRWLQETARDITALGGFTVLTLVTVIAAVVLLMYGRRLQASIFVGAVLVAQALVEGLKAVLSRARPDLVPHHDLVYSHSFPSGHSAMTPVVYFTLAALLAAGTDRLSVRVLMLGVAAGLALAVGVSRVYLGVHWPTDVLAGWTLGAAIAVVAWFLLHRTAPVRGPSETVVPDAPGAG